jgi:hypothetical protein
MLLEVGGECHTGERERESQRSQHSHNGNNGAILDAKVADATDKQRQDHPEMWQRDG